MSDIEDLKSCVKEAENQDQVEACVSELGETKREYKLILPKFDNDGHRIEIEELRKYAKEMDDHFGGITITPNVIGCEKAKGKMNCEENMEIEASEPLLGEEKNKPIETFHEDLEKVKDLADDAGDEFGQDSVFVQSDIIKDVKFVEGEKRREVPKSLREKDTFKKIIS